MSAEFLFIHVQYIDLFLVFSGLNCAEAVNFAPADWLPHGKFGAELYQLYHKTAVLSHEELLCVLAKVIIFLSFWGKKKINCLS